MNPLDVWFLHIEDPCDQLHIGSVGVFEGPTPGSRNCSTWSNASSRSCPATAGARIEGGIGWGGMTGHLNLGGAFISLAGRVFSGLVTDAAITPDPDRILAHLHAEWASLAVPVAA